MRRTRRAAAGEPEPRLERILSETRTQAKLDSLHAGY